jgi:hypothetical protein
MDRERVAVTELAFLTIAEASRLIAARKLSPVELTEACLGVGPGSGSSLGLVPLVMTGKERRIRRWEHEAVIDAMQERLDRRPDAMRIRRATVEHPFGTLKAWMGETHFKTRTLDKVRTEMSLHVLAYNLKRVVAMLGPRSLIEAIRA